MDLVDGLRSRNSMVAEQAALLDLGRRCVGLGEAGLCDLSRGELADLVVDLARDAELLTALVGRFIGLGEDNACSLVRGESSMTSLINSQGHVARTRVRTMKRAGSIKQRFPTFHTELLRGRVTPAHVDLMVQQAKVSSSMQLAAAEMDLAALAVLCTPEEFAAHLKVWDAAADPTEHLDEYLRAQAARRLSLQFDLFGNAYMNGVLTPIDAERVDALLHNRTQELIRDNPELTVLQARHDALVEFLLGPDTGRPAATIELLVPDGTDPPPLDNNTGDPDRDQFAADFNDGDVNASGFDGCGFDGEWDDEDREFMDDMVEMALHTLSSIPVPRDLGFSSVRYPRTGRGTPIPPAIVAELRRSGRCNTNPVAADGSLVADLPAGRHFTAHQKRLIRLRDTHCRHPGCRTPARWCEYDHVVAHSRGGATTVENGQLLCRFHHRWKHRHDPAPPGISRIHFNDGPLRTHPPP